MYQSIFERRGVFMKAKFMAKQVSKLANTYCFG